MSDDCRVWFGGLPPESIAELHPRQVAEDLDSFGPIDKVEMKDRYFVVTMEKPRDADRLAEKRRIRVCGLSAVVDLYKSKKAMPYLANQASNTRGNGTIGVATEEIMEKLKPRASSDGLNMEAIEDKLRDLSHSLQVRAIETYMESNPKEVRNPMGWFSSIIRTLSMGLDHGGKASNAGFNREKVDRTVDVRADGDSPRTLARKGFKEDRSSSRRRSRSIRRRRDARRSRSRSPVRVKRNRRSYSGGRSKASLKSRPRNTSAPRNRRKRSGSPSRKRATKSPARSVKKAPPRTQLASRKEALDGWESCSDAGKKKLASEREALDGWDSVSEPQKKDEKLASRNEALDGWESVSEGNKANDKKRSDAKKGGKLATKDEALDGWDSVSEESRKSKKRGKLASKDEALEGWDSVSEESPKSKKRGKPPPKDGREGWDSVSADSSKSKKRGDLATKDEALDGWDSVSEGRNEDNTSRHSRSPASRRKEKETDYLDSGDKSRSLSAVRSRTRSRSRSRSATPANSSPLRPERASSTRSKSPSQDDVSPFERARKPAEQTSGASSPAAIDSPARSASPKKVTGSHSRRSTHARLPLGDPADLKAHARERKAKQARAQAHQVKLLSKREASAHKHTGVTQAVTFTQTKVEKSTSRARAQSGTPVSGMGRKRPLEERVVRFTATHKVKRPLPGSLSPRTRALLGDGANWLKKEKDASAKGKVVGAKPKDAAAKAKEAAAKAKEASAKAKEASAKAKSSLVSLVLKAPNGRMKHVMHRSEATIREILQAHGKDPLQYRFLFEGHRVSRDVTVKELKESICSSRGEEPLTLCLEKLVRVEIYLGEDIFEEQLPGNMTVADLFEDIQARGLEQDTDTLCCQNKEGVEYARDLILATLDAKYGSTKKGKPLKLYIVRGEWDSD